MKNSSYRILETLGKGGFGITYLAEHLHMQRRVCIKEYFPTSLYRRHTDSLNATIKDEDNTMLGERCKKKFLKEARTISMMDNPHIVRVFDSFEENETAYYVMEYIEGESLADIVARGGKLNEGDARGYIEQVADALTYIHARNTLHLDVKPQNIMIRKSDGRAILIDFGLAKHYDEDSGSQTTTNICGHSDGYAPIEQYDSCGVQSFSPQTDIYALGATLYFLVMGECPPRARVIGESGLPPMSAKLSQTLRDAVKHAMFYNIKHRPRNVVSFMRILNASGSGAYLASGGHKNYTQKGSDKKSNNSWGVWLIILLLIVGAGVGVYMYYPEIIGVEVSDGGNGGKSSNINVDLNGADEEFANGDDGQTDDQTDDLHDSEVKSDDPLKTNEYNKSEVAYSKDDNGKIAPQTSVLLNMDNVYVSVDGGTQSVGFEIRNKIKGTKVKAVASVIWIKNVTTSNGRISFYVEPNTSSEERRGQITLSYGAISAKMNIVQSMSVIDDLSQHVNQEVLGLIGDAPLNIIYDTDDFSDFDILIEEKEEEIEEEEIFLTVEEMPTFQGGGLSEFRNWVQYHVKYPQIALENGIQGNVVIQFIVGPDGKMTNYRVLQSPDKTLSDATIAVLEEANKLKKGWKPGKQRGKPVKVSFTLPVSFNINNGEEKSKKKR